MSTVSPETPEASKALTAAAAGGLTAFDSADNPFSRAARQEGVQEGIYLRMNGKSGEFNVYPSNDKIEHGTPMAFLLMECQLAWQGFDRANNNKMVKGPSVPIVTGKALPAHPDDNPDVQWSKVVRVLVRMLDGSPQMTLTAKADKPTREIWKLIASYGSLMGRNRDEKGRNKIPIVEVGARSFQMDVPDEGKPLLSNGKPPMIKATLWAEQYKIVEWLTLDQLAEIEAESAAAAEEAEAGEQQAPQAQAVPQVTTQSPAAPAAATTPKASAVSQARLQFQKGRIGGR